MNLCQGKAIRTYKRKPKIKTEVDSKVPQKTVINDFITVENKQEVVEVEIPQSQVMRNLGAVVKVELNDTGTENQEVKITPDDNVRVKEEILDERLRLDEEELYAGHVVKKELVISPEMLQKPLKLTEISFERMYVEEARSWPDTQRRPPCSKRHSDADPPIHYDQPVQSYEGANKLEEDSDLLSNIWKDTDQNNYVCGICDKDFSKSNDLKLHVRSHAKEIQGCSCCNRKYYERHHTGDKPYCCRICNKEYPNNAQLHIHMRKHTGERPYCCHICSKKYANTSTFNAHMRTHTGDRPYHCHMCSKKYLTRSHLNGHIMRKHKRELASRQ